MKLSYKAHYYTTTLKPIATQHPKARCYTTPLKPVATRRGVPQNHKPDHLAKPTIVQPDDLAIGGGSLPSQTNYGGSSGGSSLPKPNPLDPTVIYNPALNKSQFTRLVL